MSSSGESWRSRLAAPALAALMVICCLAGPVLIGAAGALTAGALFGIAAAAIALILLCLSLVHRARSDRGC